MKTRAGRDKDAFGHEVYDRYRGLGGYELIERDDGHIEDSGGPGVYFSEFRSWGAHEKAAMKFARGRVLDVGCGVGRHALYLQRRGLKATGIDASPLAIKTARLRGLRDARVIPAARISEALGTFETVLLLGNNFGLMGSPAQAPKLLRRLYRVTSADAVILAESMDPRRTDDPHHVAYHRRNRRRGRWPGQLRIRVRYKAFRGDWFDYLLVSRKEMATLLEGTGWRIRKTIQSDGPHYIAVIEKVPGMAYPAQRS